MKKGNRAQWEIRLMAEEMVKIVKLIAPTLFKYAGPKCIRGKCPEGKMSCCGQLEMKNKYLII